MFCVGHGEVLDFNELQSLKRAQAHPESTPMHKHLWGQMKGKGI